MGPTKRRAATNVKYNLQEYDDMIKSALQEEELAQALAPQPIVPNTGTPKLEEGVKMTYSGDFTSFFFNFHTHILISRVFF